MTDLEMDTFIAQRVMGLTVLDADMRFSKNMYPEAWVDYEDPKPYSTDEGEAFKCIEKYCKDHDLSFDIHYEGNPQSGSGYVFELKGLDLYKINAVSVIGEPLPLAICKAIYEQLTS
jgi:hypothetical protein